MSDADSRLHWRDAMVVTLLAVVLVAGLVHFGRGLGGSSRGPGAGRLEGSSTPAGPTGEATAQLEGAPSSDPASPAPGGGTCWDGRDTTSLRLCGLPDGARGLAWVFPSFARDREQCHRARPNADSYPVVESYECVQQAMGQPVTVTYEQVRDPAQVDQWLQARIGAAHRLTIPGAHGGRCVFWDLVARPARITGLYLGFPYVVSVYAATPHAADRAWHKLVEQRPPQVVHGVKV